MSDDEDEARRSGIPLWVGLLIGFLVGLPVLAGVGVFVAVALHGALSVLGNNLSQEFNYIGSTIGSQPATIRPVEEVEVEPETLEELELEALEELLADEGAEEASPDDAGDGGNP